MLAVFIGLLLGWALAHVPSARWAALEQWLKGKFHKP